MANYTKAKDVFVQRRTIDGKFEEYPLVVFPNSFVMTDSCNNLISVDSKSVATGTASVNWLVTGSLYPITSSNALTASYLIGGSGLWLVTGSLYPITSSNAVTASYSSGSIIGYGVNNVVSLSLSQYNELTPDSNTLYIIST
jgi:hypothetical protein